MNRRPIQLLITRYLKEHSLVESNINSFNDLIERRFQEIVNEVNEEIPTENGELKLGKIRIGKPQIIEADGSVRQILPIEARLRKLTYSAPIYLEISLDGGKEYSEVEIGKLPIMVKSKACNLYGMSEAELIKNYEDPADPGGYFIINGNERVLVMIEDLAQNMALTENTQKGFILRLYSSRGSYRIPVSLHKDPEGIIYLNFSRFRNLPAILVIKALGILKDAEIASLIGEAEDVLAINLYEFSAIQTTEEALLEIGNLMDLQGTKKEILDRVKLRLDSALLPHVGTKAEARIEKALLLCKLIKHFLTALQHNFESDRDHYANKRVRLSGDLIADLFRVNLMIFVRDLQHDIKKKLQKRKFYSLKSLAKSTLFSHRIESAFATGNWIGQRTGVTQNMDKTNRLAMISQLQRVISLLPSEEENFKARTLHPTQYGRFCPIETPEGTSIGLRKNLALLTRITTQRKSEKELIETFEKLGLKVSRKVASIVKEEGMDVFLNGKFIGKANSEFISLLREKRRAQELPQELSVKYDNLFNAIFISNDSGRVLRPLIVVKDGESSLKEYHLKAIESGEIGFDDLVNLGIIEYVDAAEEDNLLIAKHPEELTSEHTHLEIDPILMFGPVMSIIPYANHNQSSRLGKVGRASKQALGLYEANYLDLADTDVSILHYPQRPIVRSFTYDSITAHPAGQNVIVAIMCWEGYNMSDAIVLNKGSVDRGLARSTYFRPYTTVELHYTGNLKDKICMPEKTVAGYRTEHAYRYLESDGLAYPEAEVSEGDVVIGKVSPPKFMPEIEGISLARAKKENSVPIRQNEKGIVDAVFLTMDAEGHKIAQVRVRDNRIPELGDKFASPHGQKGVVGFIVPEEDMPFTARGIKPDLIFNPHGIPSRLTVGYLLELLAGKVGCLKGEIIDGTAFSRQSVEELEKQLIELGFREDGKETLYDGITGKAYQAKIFIGNMYYLKLKYMVGNKIQVRSSGKVTLLTRQPIEGRARGGALRLGEMEKDALVGHGASLLLKERFSSDNVVVYICPKCGVFGVNDKIRKRKVCPLCNSQKLEAVEISYASKLLIEELMSLHLFPRFILKNKYEQ